MAVEVTAEHLFIAKVLETRSLKPIADYRIGAQHFVIDPEMGAVWEWIVNYWKRHGEIPSKSAFKRQWAHIHVPNVRDENLDGLCEELLESLQVDTLQQGLQEIVKHFENDNIPAAREALYQTYQLSEVGKTALSDFDLTESIPQRINDYLDRAENAGSVIIPGAIPTGFHGLDRITGGYQPGQLIVYTGLPKRGKTMIMLISALAAHMHGVPSEFFTFEMSAREIGFRWDGLISGLSSMDIMRGRLTKPQLTQYRDALKRFKGYQPFVISQDYSYGTTISSIKASLQKHTPRALFVDGVYMMTTEKFIPNQSERLSQIVAELKGIGRDYAIPVIATTQSLQGKTGAGSRLNDNSPGYTSAFTQYADALIGVERHPELKDMTMIRVLAGRNIQADIEFGIHWDWDISNFEEVDDMGDDDD